jgi:RNA polymerase sigma-70 factor (ECF subfamily)
MGPTNVRGDDGMFLETGSVMRGGERPLSETAVGGRTRYQCPEDVYENDNDRLVQALTVVAGSREAAADAVQEAFVRLVRDWGRVSAYQDPVAWVRRVALNLIHDHRRAVWSQARLVLRIERQPSVPEEVRSFDRELWRQVGGLPAKQRTAVALRYVGDLTLREVAEAMHVSEGTVDQHLRRALRKLRETLEGQS